MVAGENGKSPMRPLPSPIFAAQIPPTHFESLVERSQSSLFGMQGTVSVVVSRCRVMGKGYGSPIVRSPFFVAACVVGY